MAPPEDLTGARKSGLLGGSRVERQTLERLGAPLCKAGALLGGGGWGSSCPVLSCPGWVIILLSAAPKLLGPPFRSAAAAAKRELALFRGDRAWRGAGKPGEARGRQGVGAPRCCTVHTLLLLSPSGLACMLLAGWLAEQPSRAPSLQAPPGWLAGWH